MRGVLAARLCCACRVTCSPRPLSLPGRSFSTELSPSTPSQLQATAPPEYRQPLWAKGPLAHAEVDGLRVHEGPVVVFDPDEVLVAYIAAHPGLVRQRLWEGVRSFRRLAPVPVFRSEWHFVRVLNRLCQEDRVKAVDEETSDLHLVSKGTAQQRPKTKEEALQTRTYHLSPHTAVWVRQWEQHWGALYRCVLPPMPDTAEYQSMQQAAFDRLLATGDFGGMSYRELDALPLEFLQKFAGTHALESLPQVA